MFNKKSYLNGKDVKMLFLQTYVIIFLNWHNYSAQIRIIIK